jgi:hypothetical protein
MKQSNRSLVLVICLWRLPLSGFAPFPASIGGAQDAHDDHKSFNESFSGLAAPT